MKNIKLGLLPKVALAIVLGIVCGIIFPDWMGRIFVTISQFFGIFFNFFFPFLILGSLIL